LYANHSARVAAEAGFIFFDINERYFYLDRDMALDKAGILGGVTDTTCAQRWKAACVSDRPREPLTPTPQFRAAHAELDRMHAASGP